MTDLEEIDNGEMLVEELEGALLLAVVMDGIFHKKKVDSVAVK